MNRFTRRGFLRAGAAVAGAAALSACAQPSTPTPGAGTPQTVATRELRVLGLNWPQSQFEQKLADESFTPKTGIRVIFDQTPYTFLEQRVKQLVGSKSSEYDIYHYDSQWIGGFLAAGALERLDTPDYLGSPGATIRFDDFFPEITFRIGKYPTLEADLVAGNWVRFKNTPIYGLPWSLNCQVLWYRKDLIDQPPSTWAEVREMAKDLTRGGLFGWAWAGSRLSDFISVDFCPLMWSSGGQLWDEVNWKAQGFINGARSVEALQFMSDMMLKDRSVDPASGIWTIDERLAAILQGKTAMALNWAPLFGGIADDPNVSSVVGKIGFAPSPAGPAGRYAMFGSQGSGINAFSVNKSAAWEYLQWLFSFETAKALVDAPGAGFVSARKDLRDYAAGRSEWQRTFLESIPAVRDFWNNASYAELLEIMQRELNLGYIGVKEPNKALDDCALAQQVVYDTSAEKPK